VRVKEVIILGYVKEECLEQGWREKTSGHCYWCGKCEGIEKTVLHPFRMMCGRVDRINLTCRKCYRVFSGLAKLVKKTTVQKRRTK